MKDISNPVNPRKPEEVSLMNLAEVYGDGREFFGLVSKWNNKKLDKRMRL
jgi:hypothetical protein